MIQLTDNIQWDESKSYKEQSNECKNFVQNVILTYDKVTTKESITMSELFRVLTATYKLSNGVNIVESFTYANSADDAGWAEIETYKIECYA